MKKRKKSDGQKLITRSFLNSTLKKALHPIIDRLDKHDKQFEQIYKNFLEVDKNFATLNGKLAASIGINTMNIDRAVQASEERINKKLDKMLSVMDAFIKKTENNGQEITFLGRQHDDLAKFCTTKIGYPAYGRNL